MNPVSWSVKVSSTFLSFSAKTKFCPIESETNESGNQIIRQKSNLWAHRHRRRRHRRRRQRRWPTSAQLTLSLRVIRLSRASLSRS